VDTKRVTPTLLLTKFETWKKLNEVAHDNRFALSFLRRSIPVSSSTLMNDMEKICSIIPVHVMKPIKIPVLKTGQSSLVSGEQLITLIELGNRIVKLFISTVQGQEA
jgi:hypothetical protein